MAQLSGEVRGGSYRPPIGSWKPAITPPPAPAASPAVGSWRTPPAFNFMENNGGYVTPQYTAPAYSPPPPPPAWNPPAQVQQSAPQTPSFGIGAPTGGGIANAPAPAPQVKPVIKPEDWLKGDSTYQDQLGQYGTSLKDFLARLTTQKNDFQTDYSTSKDGLARNQQNGLQALGEDFTSRGLANSGLFADSRNQAEGNYKRQGNSLDSARTRALGDFTNQEKDKRASNTSAINNAKQASLSRMSNSQMF